MIPEGADTREGKTNIGVIRKKRHGFREELFLNASIGEGPKTAWNVMPNRFSLESFFEG